MLTREQRDAMRADLCNTGFAKVSVATVIAAIDDLEVLILTTRHNPRHSLEIRPQGGKTMTALSCGCKLGTQYVGHLSEDADLHGYALCIDWCSTHAQAEEMLKQRDRLLRACREARDAESPMDMYDAVCAAIADVEGKP